MEKNLTTTYFESPDTGTVYLVAPKPVWRMAGGYMEGCPLHRVDYTQFDIVLDGNLVQFCFDEADIADTVKHYEFPGHDGVESSTFD